MMSKIRYINKLIYEMTLDCRAKKKNLSRMLKISPQLVSYSTKKLKKDKYILDYKAQIDPAKFGMTNVIVYIIFTNFEKELERAVKEQLRQSENVTLIQKLSQGADLCVEYTVPNLSLFNKLHSGFLDTFGKDVQVVDIFPVIVKHDFPKKYLNRRSKHRLSKILSGDREPVHLQENARKVLSELIKNPTQNMMEITKKTGLNIRTVIKMKRFLESRKIIMGYTAVLNYEKMDINACQVLINFDYLKSDEIKRIINYAMYVPEIVSIIKIIGRYTLIIKIESLGSYRKVLNDLRKEFRLYNYVVYDIENIIKKDYIPESAISG